MTPPRRPPTQTERDTSNYLAKLKRDQATPVYVCEEVTGQYVGEDLDRARARRPTDERMARLEKKNDELLAKIVEFSTIKLTASIEGNRAEVTDIIDGRKSRRELVKSIVLGILALVNALLIGRAVL